MDARWTRAQTRRLGRRTVMALAAMAATLPHGATMAQATPPPAGAQPNTFRLAGEGVDVTYAATSNTGEPTLSYRGPGGDMEFRGDQIEVESSGILGPMVSVIVDVVNDGYTEWLTLLLPMINLRGDNVPTPFSTVAIRTRHLTTIAGSGMIEGQLQEYEALQLDGTAELLFY